MRFVWLVFFIPGLLACFLPFTYDASPFGAVSIFYSGFSRTIVKALTYGLGRMDFSFRYEQLLFLSLGLPFFLSFPILFWKAKTSFAKHFSRKEYIASYICAITAVSLFSIVYLRIYWDAISVSQRTPIIDLVVVLGVLNLPLVLCSILMFLNFHKGVSHGVNAPLCMLLAYFPNTLLLIYYFKRDLELGAYVTMFTCAVYLVETALLTRRGWKAVSQNATIGSDSP